MRAPLLRPGWLADLMGDPDFNAHAKRPAAIAGSPTGAQLSQPGPRADGPAASATNGGAPEQGPEHTAPADAVAAEDPDTAAMSQERHLHAGAAQADSATAAGSAAGPAQQVTQQQEGQQEGEQPAALDHPEAGESHVLGGQTAPSAAEASAGQQQAAAPQQAGEEQPQLTAVPRPNTWSSMRKLPNLHESLTWE